MNKATRKQIASMSSDLKALKEKMENTAAEGGGKFYNWMQFKKSLNHINRILKD